jgi:hypothetical protein
MKLESTGKYASPSIVFTNHLPVLGLVSFGFKVTGCVDAGESTSHATRNPANDPSASHHRLGGICGSVAFQAGVGLRISAQFPGTIVSL